METLLSDLPFEQPYYPPTSDAVLAKLAVAPGSVAEETARLGRGKCDLPT